MKTFNNLYGKIYDFHNLVLAWKKARKRKTKKKYVVEFEANLRQNILQLQEELKSKNYLPLPLMTFVVKDPKTRKISKSDFRDRIVYHGLYAILNPIYERIFIQDSCAGRKGKGNLYALKKFYKYLRKVSKNGRVYKNKFNDSNYIRGYCLKADIKHYFQEIDHNILFNMLEKKITDKDLLDLIKKIVANFEMKRERELLIKECLLVI